MMRMLTAVWRTLGPVNTKDLQLLCQLQSETLLNPLVSLQYSMKRYLDFTKGAFSDSVTGGRPNW